MKKNLTLLLVCVCMLINLSACGSINDQERNEEEIIYSVGDTVTLDMVELTLNSVEYNSNSTSKSGREIFVDGKDFVTIDFNIKNVGKTDLGYFDVEGGTTTCLYSMPFVDYNDGYIFRAEEVTDILGDLYNPLYGFFFKSSDENIKYTNDLEPLSKEINCVVDICVPDEVVDKTSNTLIIGFSCPSEDGTKIIKFKVR